MKFKILISILLVIMCAFPVMAQQPTGTLNSVSFNGFSFNFDSSLATNVNISQFAGDAADLQQPGGPEVRHTQFLLYSTTTSPESFLDATGAIRVYQTADFATYPNAQTQLQQLQTLLTDRPDPASFMVVYPNGATSLPFMPQMPASQVIRARVAYVNTPVMDGVSYITVYRQDVSPFVSSEFLYTFQGISADGLHYVSAIFRVNASAFPAEIPADFDMDTFNATFNDYLVESVDMLNQGGVETFTPLLAPIEALIQSIGFAPTSGGGVVVAPTATATALVNEDPTFGGLAGVTWILTSYGAPEAPTAAIPNVPVTIGFSETGVAGNSGCNGYGGAFTYNNGALTISNVVGTLMACADNNVNVQEAAYLAALSTATNYQIVGNQLQIAYNGGVLVFTNALALTPTVTVTETATIAPTATP
jgi:heat shock protein HslJ